MTDLTNARPSLDEFVRFERVSSVEETERGLLARLHGEQLRVDLIRDDIVRVKISRGGVFDESPTSALCVDPLSEGVTFTGETGDGVVRLRSADLVVSLWLDPFRLDVHRPDGSAITETARDDAGAYWSYATLNDAFAICRRRGPNDAIYGLGEKTGTHNRSGRDFTLWNTDVLDPHATAEFIAGRPDTDPRADHTSTDFDPYY
ncbi:MAG: alpha-glucosidase, partial [Solirubrobacteraceae bacterium]|nr:alpha-glucosidase [Solirubrobacteraceae bacterium]